MSEPMPSFPGTRFTDVKTLRQRARQDIEPGAVTPGYAADRHAVVQMLNEALATELICVLRYKRHYYHGLRPAFIPNR